MPAEPQASVSTADHARYAHQLALFHEAMNLPNQERRDFVESACAGDSALFAEIKGMLEVDSGGPSLLDEDLGSLAQRIFAPKGSVDLAQVGPYRLIRMLGEGGMGMVYLAERSDVGNAVAIKFLRDAWLSPARSERFLSEQRLLAPLNHPSIARFYDAGTLDNGMPWFAMEYVEGIPLTEHCRLHQCTLEQRLRLFHAICVAVQYAHEHAVIHRDLKPSNILVKADGAVRLLDFGIAKQIGDLSEPVDQTQTLRLLTPAYAAPEQIRGEPVGVFTDVYALGVILYELLVGRTPFDVSKKTPDQTGRMVVDGAPERPSLVVRLTPGPLQLDRTTWTDLDVLCLAAMHKDVPRRYRSVEALIRDVDRYLKNEPLEARPDSLPYRTGKFMRRNRRALSVAALLTLLIAAMAIVFTLRLARSRDAALAAAARTQRVQRFILNLFEGGDKSAAPAEDLRVLALVDQGLKEAQTLRRDPEMQADLYQTLGGIYQKLGNLPRADSLLGNALKERTARIGSEDGDLADSLIALGLLRVDQARFDDAERLVRNGLAKIKAARPTNEASIAQATAALGKVLTARGSYKAAIPLLEEAVRLQSRAGPDSPELAASLKYLADTQFYAGHYDVCEALNQRTLALDLRLFGKRHPRVADDLINLGAIQFEREHFKEAERLDRRALDIMEGWYGNEHPETASALFMLSKALVAQNKLNEAVLVLHQAASIQEHAFGPAHPRLATILNQLAIIAYTRNQLDEAEAQYKRVIAIYKGAYGEHHPWVALARANLAAVYMSRKNYSRAEQILRQVIESYRQTLSADHLDAGVAQVRLGRALLRQRKYQEASEQTLAGYLVLRKQVDPSSAFPRAALKDLIEEYAGLKQPEQAERYREELKAGTKEAREDETGKNIR